VFRGLTDEGLADWDALASSGLLKRLVDAGELVATERADGDPLDALRAIDPQGEWVGALRHERVPFVSYPYEWTFSMLRDAALLQLAITRQALAAGLALKDATHYNVQWRGARPVFIDVGSYERARAGEPWLGYRQFCMLFLYPLLLEAYRGIPFQPWLRGSLEGVHPSQARSLLRGRDTFRGGVLKHVALHAKLERSHADGEKDVRRELKEAGFDKQLVEANLKALEKLVRGLETPEAKTEWSDYGTTCSYSDEDTRAKEDFVRTASGRCRRSLVWDLGANDGRYSRIAADVADYTVALDADQGVVLGAVVDDRQLQVGVVASLVAAAAGAEQLGLADREVADLGLGARLVAHLRLRLRHLPSAARAQHNGGQEQHAHRGGAQRAVHSRRPPHRFGPVTAGSVTRVQAEPNGPSGRSARRERRSSARPPSGGIRFGRRARLPIKEGAGRSGWKEGACAQDCPSTTSSRRRRPVRPGRSRSSTATCRRR
jgi:hypothetical protein